MSSQWSIVNKSTSHWVNRAIKQVQQFNNKTIQQFYPLNIILFDTEARKKLFPLTATRAVADVRMGILTMKERWEKLTGLNVFVLTDSYLQPLYMNPPKGEALFIHSCVLPNEHLIDSILNLANDEAIEDRNGLIAGRMFLDALPSMPDVSSLFKSKHSVTPVKRISSSFELFQWNNEWIDFDFKLVTKGRTSANTNSTVHTVNTSQIFIEEGASIDHSILNASAGPIYIGNDALIMEGCFIRGPFALCEGAVVKMGAKIYGATTIGPYCTAGGEIKNSILTGYSNKAHDGYLGDSVLGEWCNLGAGTSNSNLKNTAGIINLWDNYSKSFLPAGNKCGVIMGDYSRTAINSSINTGSVIGVCCNVFGEGLLPTIIPNFSWGAKQGNRYEFEKAVKDINNWKRLKNKTITEQEAKVLKHIFDAIE